jgi:hypothetical protein
MPDHAMLSAEAHRDLRVRTDRDAALGDAVMCCITVPTEFREVQADYPILFRLDYETDRFTALALFGFEEGENLFLGAEGWDARYVPLAVAIQPFLIGRAAPDAPPSQVHVDLASPRIDRDGGGVRLFDEDGRPTPYLDNVAEQLGALHEGYEASNAFFAALRRHSLLEPLTLEVTLDSGAKNNLVGFHVIDEEALRDLDAAALGALHDADHLMPIFMAVASIGKLQSLVARKNRRVANG